MRKASLIKAGVAGAAALAVGVGLAVPANADPQAQQNDAVIVGSDTVQFLADFVADGQSAIAGTTGLTSATPFNSTNKYRMYSIDATVDAKGRTATIGNGTNNFAVVLRAGQAPVHLPNGSGNGYDNFYQDTLHQIDLVRGSRLPNSGDISHIQGTQQHYHSWRIAADGMQVAVSNVASNAPSGGLSKAQLAGIYQASPSITNWSQAGGTGSDLIVPLLPQDGSGTHDDFLTDILGSKATPANTHLVRTEEHDPTSLTATGFTSKIEANGGAPLCTNDGTRGGTASPANANFSCPTGFQTVTDPSGLQVFTWQGGVVTAADAISPFSSGRYNLIQTGYFDVGNSYGTALTDPAWKNAIQLLPFTQDSGTGAITSGYFLQRFFYLTALDSAYTASGGWQPGASVNKINTIVNWYKKATNAAAYADAGVSFNLPAYLGGGPAFKDCLVDATSC